MLTDIRNLYKQATIVLNTINTFLDLAHKKEIEELTQKEKKELITLLKNSKL